MRGKSAGLVGDRSCRQRQVGLSGVSAAGWVNPCMWVLLEGVPWCVGVRVFGAAGCEDVGSVRWDVVSFLRA